MSVSVTIRKFIEDAYTKYLELSQKEHLIGVAKEAAKAVGIADVDIKSISYDPSEGVVTLEATLHDDLIERTLREALEYCFKCNVTVVDVVITNMKYPERRAGNECAQQVFGVDAKLLGCETMGDDDNYLRRCSYIIPVTGFKNMGIYIRFTCES